MIGIVFEILIYGKATSTHAFRPFVNKTRFVFAIGRSTKNKAYACRVLYFLCMLYARI